MTARGGMLMGSCPRGIAFLKGLGLVHAILHMAGGEFNTQPGLTNAILFPVVLRFNLQGQEHKVRRMVQAMKLPDTSVEGFITAIEAMLDQIGIPKSLGEIGVTAQCAARLAEKSLQDSAARTNPRKAKLAEIRELTETAIARAR